MRMFALVVVAVSLGCSSSTDVTAAEQAALSFHKHLDAGQFNQIYERSAEELKRTSAQSDFVALLDAVHRKLGRVQSAEREAWSVNYRTSGAVVTLTYKTVYSEGGEAVEQFVFTMQDHKAALDGYHISANALATR